MDSHLELENLAALPFVSRGRVGLSPRPPSVLMSPSPRLLLSALEPLTPDRAPVPFCSSDDVKELVLPVLSAPQHTSALQLPVMDCGVVDEHTADFVFADARNRSDPLFTFQLRSPCDLPAGSFPGSSNLPTPGLSQRHINQLAQRPTQTPPLLPPTPPLVLPQPDSVAADDNAARLPRLLAAPPPPASWPTNVWPSAVGVQQWTHPLSSIDGESDTSSASKSGSTSVGVSERSKCLSTAKSSSEQPQCDICHTRFARRSNLYKHQRSVHSTRRQYKCEICNYGFKRQDHLLKHKRGVHTKERRYACDICGTAFAEKYNKQKHMRVIHETKRPFRCGCGAYFQHRDQMLGCLRCKQATSKCTS